MQKYCHFKKCNICFIFFSTVSLLLRGRNLKLMCNPQKKKELQRAEEELQSLIKYQVIPVESGYDEITAEEEWQALCAKIESEGKLRVVQNESEEIKNTEGKCGYH